MSDYPLTTGNIGLPLVPDGDGAWGQAVRDGFQAIDSEVTTLDSAVTGINSAITAINTHLVVVDQEIADLQDKFKRKTSTATTTLIPATSVTLIPITLAPCTMILTVATNYPAEVRLYESSASRLADYGRLTTDVPPTGKGLICQNTLVLGAMSVNQSPVSVFTNRDTPESSVGYLAVTNNDTVARVITATITHLVQE